MLTGAQFEKLPDLFREIIMIDAKIQKLVSVNPFEIALHGELKALQERRGELRRAARGSYGKAKSGPGGPALA